MKRVQVWAGVGAVVAGVLLSAAKLHSGEVASAPAPALASVSVSTPLQRDLDTQAAFLGQYSAVEKVELRAQVGGTPHRDSLQGRRHRPQGRSAVRDRSGAVPDPHEPGAGAARSGPGATRSGDQRS